jgi:hypothetical protein
MCKLLGQNHNYQALSLVFIGMIIAILGVFDREYSWARNFLLHFYGINLL